MTFQDPQNPYGGGVPFDWSKLYDFGTGMLSNQMGQNEARARLGAAQGPVYNAANTGAASSIAAAGNMDPNTFAAQRFQQQQALVNPAQQKQIEDVRRSLQARGIGGLGVYNPGIEGFTPNGQVVSPELAAAYAGINSANNKSAYGAMDEGQTYLNNLLQRSGMLTTQAGNAQTTGLAGQGRLPSRAAGFGQFATGLGSVLKQPGMAGMLGQGVDWLGNKTGFWDSNFGGNQPTNFDQGIDWNNLYG